MRIFTTIIATAIGFPTIALAQLAWDTDGGAAGDQGGSGNWTGTDAWWNGTANVVWASPNSATFGGTPGRVAVNTDTTATGLIFSVGGYLIAGPGTLTLDGASALISVPSGITRIDANMLSLQGFSKVGAGTLALSGNNNHSGPMGVESGTLRLESNTVAHYLWLKNSTSARVEAAAGVAVLTRTLTGGFPGGVVQLGQGSTLVMGYDQGAFPENGAFNGTILGDGNVVKAGPGTQTLTGLTTYSGTTTITGGTLSLDGTPALPTTTAVILQRDGQSTLNSTSGIVTRRSAR